jgi:hypothetical protein
METEIQLAISPKTAKNPEKQPIIHKKTKKRRENDCFTPRRPPRNG